MHFYDEWFKIYHMQNLCGFSGPSCSIF